MTESLQGFTLIVTDMRGENGKWLRGAKTLEDVGAATPPSLTLDFDSTIPLPQVGDIVKVGRWRGGERWVVKHREFHYFQDEDKPRYRHSLHVNLRCKPVR